MKKFPHYTYDKNAEKLKQSANKLLSCALCLANVLWSINRSIIEAMKLSISKALHFIHFFFFSLLAKSLFFLKIRSQKRLVDNLL